MSGKLELFSTRLSAIGDILSIGNSFFVLLPFTVGGESRSVANGDRARKGSGFDFFAPRLAARGLGLLMVADGRLGLRSCNGLVREEVGVKGLDLRFGLSATAIGIGFNDDPRNAGLGFGRNGDFDFACNCGSSPDVVGLFFLKLGNFRGL